MIELFIESVVSLNSSPPMLGWISGRAYDL